RCSEWRRKANSEIKDQSSSSNLFESHHQTERDGFRIFGGHFFRKNGSHGNCAPTLPARDIFSGFASQNLLQSPTAFCQGRVLNDPPEHTGEKLPNSRDPEYQFDQELN